MPGRLFYLMFRSAEAHGRQVLPLGWADISLGLPVPQGGIIKQIPRVFPKINDFGLHIEFVLFSKQIWTFNISNSVFRMPVAFGSLIDSICSRVFLILDSLKNL